MGLHQQVMATGHASPMPWIGMYIAAASLVCTLAMAADTFHSFRRKKFWIPCKFFTLNAASLALLAVTTKLSVDLSTTSIVGVWDELAKLSSTILMTTIMGNFMISLGSMDGKSLLMNVTAAAILVITIIVDVSIQLKTEIVGEYIGLPEEILATVFMFVLLLTSCFSALSVPATKKYLEIKYHQYYKTVLGEELVGRRKLTIKELELALKKFWVMAETNSPQFVMARSVICATSSAICLLNTLILVKAWIQMRTLMQYEEPSDSDYGEPIMWIVAIQSIGVVVGTISPMMRLFIVVYFNCSRKGVQNYKKEFRIEPFWIEKLVEWKRSPLPLRIGGRKCRKLLQSMKNLVLDFFIRAQMVIVIVSKLVLLILVSLVTPIFSCFYHIKRLKMEYISESGASDEHIEQKSGPNMELDLERYVLLLEGEVELPKKTLNNICYEVDQLSQIGRKRKPENLIKLLGKSINFSGVKDFDCNQFPSLHLDEFPNGWTLPVVTLTSIAIALPNIDTRMIDQLISSVVEGLRYANLVEKSLDEKGNFINIRNVANIVWERVELYHEWLDENLMQKSCKGKTSREILQKFSDIAEESVKKFNGERKESLMENHVDRLMNFFAADSMYRISQTLLLASEGGNNQSDEELFKQLSIMIADILSACLTNLPHIVCQKFYNNVIEEREESIRHAAQLLGEIEDILKVLENHEIPGINPDDAMYIDKWRAILASLPTSHSTTVSALSSEEHVVIDIMT